jgi:tetratricopeptide (TPR) repeat protein
VGHSAATATAAPSRALRLATWYWGALLIVAPAYLGSSVNTTGVAFFPETPLAWCFGAWPAPVMPVLTGLGLILVALAAPPTPGPVRPLWPLWLPAVALVVGMLPGLARTTEWDLATGLLWHVFGVALAVWAVLALVRAHPPARQVLLWCIAAGCAWSIYQGFYQWLAGFAETKAAIQEKLRQGEHVPNAQALILRLDEARVSAAFTYPNNYAAHLLLTLPVVGLLVWQWARRVDPPRPSQILLTTLVSVPIALMLVRTGSRAALVALALATALVLLAGGWTYRAWLRQHATVLLLALLAGLAALAVAYLLVGRGRGLSSLAARLDYWRSAWLMFCAAPATGVGLGEFFPWHLRLKPPGAEETRLAHNLFFDYLSQAGVIGGLAALCFLAQPLLLWYHHWRGRLGLVSRPLWLAVVLGCTAWGLHALADFNLYIPGTLLTVAVLPLLAVTWPAGEAPARGGAWRLAAVLLGLVGMAQLWRMPGEAAFQDFSNRSARPLGVEQAMVLADRAGRGLPHSPYPYDLLGKIALSQQRYEIAAQAFAEAVRRAPHRAAYHAYLAEALAQLGQFDAARQHAAEAVRWYPHKPNYQALHRQLTSPPPPHAP